jgi:hypothetical protein
MQSVDCRPPFFTRVDCTPLFDEHLYWPLATLATANIGLMGVTAQATRYDAARGMMIDDW